MSAEGNGSSDTFVVASSRKGTPGRPWTPEQRAKLSKTMRVVAKKWWAERKRRARDAELMKTNGPKPVKYTGYWTAERRHEHALRMKKVSLAKWQQRREAELKDAVNHPLHYTSHPSGVECITITEHMNFNVGNAVKYLWRAGSKGEVMEDLKKAQWYINREIRRIQHAKAL